MRICAQSPCRVDLAGGTLDIWPLYLYHQPACTVNFAINCFTRCSLETRREPGILLRSIDLRAEETFASLDDLASRRRYRLPLLAWLLRFFRPRGGLAVTVQSEAPAGAGISGSSSLMITLASALNRLARAAYSKEKLREICQNVESQVIRAPTGSQDYYPALYGGLNAMELTPSGVQRTPISVAPADLNARFLLAYTGAPRDSGVNNWEVYKAHLDGDRRVQRNFDEIAAIAWAMRDALARRDWQETARLLRAEWSHRRRNIPTISTPTIDRLTQAACRSGALAAKACGAGGGGCVVFLVEPDAKSRVAEAIRAAGAAVLPFRLAMRGVRVTQERS